MEESLLEQVLENPADDAPRLIYADYLLEYGDPVAQLRGEFIQLQVAIHRRDPAYLLDEGMSWKIHENSADPTVRRTVEVLRLLYAEDKGTSWGYFQRLQSRVWRRGFLDKVRFYNWDGFEKHGPAIASQHPLRLVEIEWLRPRRMVEVLLPPGVTEGPIVTDEATWRYPTMLTPPGQPEHPTRALLAGRWQTREEAERETSARLVAWARRRWAEKEAQLRDRAVTG